MNSLVKNNVETSLEGCPPTVSASRTLDTMAANPDPLRVLIPDSGSIYGSAGYRRLASLAQAESPVTVVASPPRKLKRMPRKPGKVMKLAYFKGIQWTRTFVSGPVEPIHKRYKFCSQIY